MVRGGGQQQAKQRSAVTTETVVKKLERYIQQEIGLYIYIEHLSTWFILSSYNVVFLRT